MRSGAGDGMMLQGIGPQLESQAGRRLVAEVIEARKVSQEA